MESESWTTEQNGFRRGMRRRGGRRLCRRRPCCQKTTWCSFCWIRFDYCYNAQAVVDSENQIIVAAEMTTAANDKQQAVPLAQAVMANLASAGIERPLDDQDQPLPIPNTADSGYYSEDNVRDVAALGFMPTASLRISALAGATPCCRSRGSISTRRRMRRARGCISTRCLT